MLNKILEFKMMVTQIFVLREKEHQGS